MQKNAVHTFEVLRALSFLAGFADDLDWLAGEHADDLFLVISRDGDDLDKGLDLLPLLVCLRDVQLFSDASSHVGCTIWSVSDVEGFPRRAGPLNRAFWWRGFARD